MIYISITHTCWKPSVGGIRFQNWLAHKYVEEVRKAIDYEIYKSRWRQLSPRYRAYKQRNHLSPKMWEATGDLKNRLAVKFGLVVGFEGHGNHSGSKASCLQIARYLEYGTASIPARPLFRTVYYEMHTFESLWYSIYLEETGNEF